MQMHWSVWVTPYSLVKIPGTWVGWILDTNTATGSPHCVSPRECQYNCPTTWTGCQHPTSVLPPRSTASRLQSIAANGEGSSNQVPPQPVRLHSASRRTLGDARAPIVTPTIYSFVRLFVGWISTVRIAQAGDIGHAHNYIGLSWHSKEALIM